MELNYSKKKIIDLKLRKLRKYSSRKLNGLIYILKIVYFGFNLDLIIKFIKLKNFYFDDFLRLNSELIKINKTKILAKLIHLHY